MVPCRNPRSLRRCDQRALINIKSDIEISKDKLFFVNHMSAGSTRNKWYLLQVNMDQSDLFSARNYGVYYFQWYIRQYEDCNKYPTMECRFWTEIVTKNQDDKLGKMLPVTPSKVHNLLEKNQTHVWYQGDISLDGHRLVGPFQFGTAGRNKLKHPNMIEDKQWKAMDKEG